LLVKLNLIQEYLEINTKFGFLVKQKEIKITRDFQILKKKRVLALWGAELWKNDICECSTWYFFIEEGEKHYIQDPVTDTFDGY
jgi:hypothetical protein